MMATAAIFVFFKLVKDQLIVQKRALMLEKEKAETELKLLKAQLNPHFLFNTLNNIYSLSFTSSSLTSPSIARLADILDHVLYRCDGQFVAIDAEIGLVKNYIELEKLRYDERLTVNFTTEVDGPSEIVPLVLLSLVENAFKHGAAGDAGKPSIDIYLHASPENINFNIRNSVPPGNVQKSAANEGIGLNNLRRQLNLVYGDGYRLDVKREDGYFNVQLMISLKTGIKTHEKDALLVG
jgi:LytS/YehU family sensor histidine kinase